MDIYLKSVFMHLKCDMQYKVSFILMTLSSTMSTLLNFIGTIILLNSFGGIKGWTINEIILTTGIALFGFVFTEMFGRGLDNFHKEVKKGTFDRVLIRPRSITLQVLCLEFQTSKIGRLVQGVIFLIYGIATVNISWTAYKAFVMILVIVRKRRTIWLYFANKSII